jgi:2-polyprenyl-3-methyl-5-hydroxy-6-metoxy-1,4-benzoquinol methylase
MDRPLTDFGWNSAQPHDHQTMLLPIISRLLPALPGKLLDLGCGNGWLSEQYRKAGFEVTACDRSLDGLRVGQAAFPHVDFIQRDLYEDLGGPYDCIVASEVIEHLFAPVRMLGRAFDALRPGGTLLLSTPYHGWLKNIVIAGTGKFDSHVDVAFEGGHIKFFSRAALARMMRKTGFERIEFRGAGRVPFLWKSMIMSGRKPAL